MHAGHRRVLHTKQLKQHKIQLNNVNTYFARNGTHTDVACNLHIVDCEHHETHIMVMHSTAASKARTQV